MQTITDIYIVERFCIINGCYTSLFKVWIFSKYNLVCKEMNKGIWLTYKTYNAEDKIRSVCHRNIHLHTSKKNIHCIILIWQSKCRPGIKIIKKTFLSNYIRGLWEKFADKFNCERNMLPVKVIIFKLKLFKLYFVRIFSFYNK